MDKLINAIRNVCIDNYLNIFWDWLKKERKESLEKKCQKIFQKLSNFFNEKNTYRSASILVWDETQNEHFYSYIFFNKRIGKKINKFKDFIFEAHEAEAVEFLVLHVLKSKEKKMIHININSLNNLNEDINKLRKGFTYAKSHSDFFNNINSGKKLKDLIKSIKSALKKSGISINDKIVNNLLLLLAYDKKWRHIYIIPAMIPIPKGTILTSEYPAGGIFLTTTKELSGENIYIFTSFATEICSKTANILKQISMMNHALRSAVAAVMARNLSHNIGSHVLAYYEQSLNSMSPSEVDGACDEFNRYLQARMDYIAYVTTITPSYGCGFTLREVIDEFNSNKILVKGLAASENFYEVEIKLEDPSYENLLSFPMAELGKQAFFNILEGITRNTAKHGYPHGGKNKLIIHVKAEDKDDVVQLEIWDDANSYAKAKKDLNLNGDIEKDARYHNLIDDKGTLQSEFWGIKEMRISSLFLKKIPISRIQDPELLPIELKDKNKCLCYVLDMYKFKYVLIITNKVKGFFKGEYIDIINKNELNKLDKTEYKLCVIDENINLSPEEELNLPLRRVKIKADSIIPSCKNNKMNNEKEKNIVLYCYEKWLETRAKSDSLKIIYSPAETDNKIKKIAKNWRNIIQVKKINPNNEKDKENINNGIVFSGHLIGTPELIQEYMNGKPLFIQDVSGKTQYLKNSLNSPIRDDFKKEIFKYEIIEAAYESVIIFDERLWKIYKDKEKEGYPTYFQKGQKVVIANLVLENEKNKKNKEINFKDLENRIILKIKKQENTDALCFNWDERKDSFKYTFACFHLGIIEKISDIFSLSVSKVIKSLLRDKNKCFEHLIIHTGRGKTVKYDMPLLYMDLTSLQRAIQEGKIYLIQSLYSLRPTKGE